MVVADRVDRDCRDECVALLVVKIYSWGKLVTGGSKKIKMANRIT